ncbi:MAG: response regulator transcription factor [Gammaproteobacteria bacterium]|nr:response regulator transcription factor [Gammaproteobacteria bacterium]
MRILIVEDDDRISDFLVRGLQAEGHACVRVSCGQEGLALGTDADVDLIILDLLLPDMHGRDVCQELRARGVLTPVLMLTALGGINDIVLGLRMGADDYMTKPFDVDELLARIEALHRRGKHPTLGKDVLTFGDITFDRETMRVSAASEPIDLTAKELAILELLMTKPGKVYSRERVLNNVWGLSMDPLTNVVDVHISKLRKKLTVCKSTSVIETVRGLGYRLATSDNE